MWRPQPGPQLAAIQATWCNELFFGGARGGGKSDYLLGDFARDVPTYREAWCGVLFRKTYPELEELVARSRMIYPATFPGADYLETKREWKFPGGASLKMRHLESDADAESYQGHQYSWIGWDELPLRSSLGAYNLLKACLRSAAAIPDKRIRSTGNPGGAGHQLVKSYFRIDRHRLGMTPFEDLDTGMTRMFVPSRVTDNLILLLNDPGYVARLRGVGSAELVKAWLDGDWDAVAGAYFDCWSAERHIVRPFVIPAHWTRFRSMDWGSAKPFSVGWWAVADGEPAIVDGRQRTFPAGALVRYREWYGAKAPNEGLKLTVEAVAQGILARTPPIEKISYTVVDSSVFDEDGGPSQAERMAKVGMVSMRADKRRVPGWDQLRQRLVGDGERPMLYAFDTCRDLIRTLPALQHDKVKAEDLDSDGEDHAADEVRYACMSRPWTKTAEKIRTSSIPTFEEIMKEHDRMRSDSRERI